MSSILELAALQPVCTMRAGKAALKLSKMPVLKDIYHKLTGQILDGAHDARNDTLACVKVYARLLDMLLLG